MDNFILLVSMIRFFGGYCLFGSWISDEIWYFFLHFIHEYILYFASYGIRHKFFWEIVRLKFK